mgnify:CR=1 FL=1
MGLVSRTGNAPSTAASVSMVVAKPATLPITPDVGTKTCLSVSMAPMGRRAQPAEIMPIVTPSNLHALMVNAVLVIPKPMLVVAERSPSVSSENSPANA